MDREQRSELNGLLTRLGTTPPIPFDEPDQIITELKRRGAPYYPIRPDETSFIADYAKQLNRKPSARELPSAADLFHVASIPSPNLTWLRLRVARQMMGYSHEELASQITRMGKSLSKPQMRWRETDPNATKGKHVSLGSEGVLIAKCLKVRPEWLFNGTWTDVPYESGIESYSIEDSAKIMGIGGAHPELRLKEIPGISICVLSDTESASVHFSDSVFFDRAVQLGLATRDDIQSIKTFHDSINLSVEARVKVLAHTLGKPRPKTSFQIIPRWLRIYALCVQHAWQVKSDVVQKLSNRKVQDNLPPPPLLSTATASRWINLYFTHAIEPALTNHKRSMKTKKDREWRDRMLSCYLAMHGFVHLFPCIYPFMHRAGKKPIDYLLNFEFVEFDS